MVDEEIGMPAKRELSMRQLRHLLRLHHGGVSAREVGRRLGVARSTVYGALAGWKGLAARAEEGFADIETAKRLSPRDLNTWFWDYELCALHDQLAQWDQAVSACQRSLAANPNNFFARFDLAAAYGWLGREAEAKAEWAEGLK